MKKKLIELKKEHENIINLSEIKIKESYLYGVDESKTQMIFLTEETVKAKSVVGNLRNLITTKKQIINYLKNEKENIKLSIETIKNERHVHEDIIK
jgi:hypothetical protein